MEVGDGATSTPRKMRFFVLKGAEGRGERSFEAVSVMNGERKPVAGSLLPFPLIGERSSTRQN